jgi:predicted glutamine amidotransferase
MCRLLGIIANKPVDVKFSMGYFRDLAEDNRDGWGIGWYEDDKAHLHKEKISAMESENFEPQSQKVSSRIVISHVRCMTRGEPSKENSHPFKHREWLFAHNGTVNREHLINLLNEEHRNALEGETDSEVYFHYILQCIEKNSDPVVGIQEALKEIRPLNKGELNFLLSNGKELYAFRWGNTLFWLKRDPTEPGPLTYQSEETQALLESKALKGERAIVVCSEEISDEEWDPVKEGVLLRIGPVPEVEEIQIEI